MAISFRAAAHNQVGSTPLAISVPTGTLDNDVMIAVVVVGSAAHTPSTPSGWTAIDSEATGPSIQSYYRVASSEPANYSWTAVTANAMAGVISSYSGVNIAAPINQHSAFHRTTVTNIVTADSITTSTNGCMLVWCGGAAASPNTFTGPTSYNQRDTAAGSGMAAMIADLLQTTAGSTGSVTATGTAGSYSTQGTLIALSPYSPPVNTVAPAVTGTAATGSTLTTTDGTWT